MTMEQQPLRVDSHVHLWKVARGDYDWMSPDLGAIYRDFGVQDLEPLLAAASIDRVVLVQAAATLAESRYLLEIADQSSRVGAVVGWIDFESPAAVEQLGALAQHPKFRGVRPMIQFLPEQRWMLGRNLRPVWEAIATRGLTADFLVAPAHLGPLHELLREHSTLRGVIDHAAKPQIAKGEFAEWARDIRQVARNTSALCKLSGLVTEAGESWTVDALRPYFDELLSEFAPDRIMFGSDWPVVTLASEYGRWWETVQTLLANLTAAQRSAILGGTAARFYGL